MESPSYPESPSEQDDVVYPCKGCGEILEEGKAFELAGNRWHIDCFRCNTCGSLLDSDANLLLLGDGSLICNNCTYSCSTCGQKIEDLAILTGDQAFCASCFRCRNCKRKIENLRYARTSQGIFCMSCHESLMARRRKKGKKSTPSSSNGTTPVVLDKSLPALPPSAVSSSLTSQFTPEIETPPSDTYNETPTELSPHPQTMKRKEIPRRDPRRDASPASVDSNNNKDNLTLPSTTYRENRHSRISQASDTANVGGADDGFDIPMVLDPSIAPGPAPLPPTLQAAPEVTERRAPSKDYFARTGQSAQRDTSAQREARNVSRPESTGSTPRSPQPHIAYQEKGRQTSSEWVDTMRKRKDASAPASSAASPTVGSDRPRAQHTASPSVNSSAAKENDGFKLQDVPQSRKASSRQGSVKSATQSPTQASPAMDLVSRTKNATPETRITESPSRLEDSPKPLQDADSVHSQNSLSQQVERPKRGDSLQSSTLKQNLQRKESTQSTGPNTPTNAMHERKPSTSSVLTNRDANSMAQKNGGRTISKPIESPTSKSIMDTPIPPARAAGHGRPVPPVAAPSEDSFTAPRLPPPPPPPSAGERHRNNESISTIASEMHPASPMGSLPRYSGAGEFSMDPDLDRFITGDENMTEKDASMLRKVSNAVRHGRSFSDRGSRSSQSARWRSPQNGSLDISSPTTASPDSKDEVIQLRNALKHAQQQVAQLQAHNSLLEQTVNNSADIKQMNTELREKRSTMAILDTQREMVVRELEVMTDHLKHVKDSKEPLDLDALKSGILKDFAASLNRLKDNLSRDVEDLMHTKNEITEEIGKLIQMKDKGFQEYESLSTKNKQLVEVHNQLVHNIQELYKANRAPNGQGSVDGGRGLGAPNGLGIYPYGHQKDKSDVSIDMRTVTEDSTSQLMPDPDGDDVQMLQAPKVVDIRKGKPSKFGNWGKGLRTVGKQATKGVKGWAGAQQQHPSREGSLNTSIESMPYGAVSAGDTPTTIKPMGGQSGSNDPRNQNHGFFGGPQKTPQRANQSRSEMQQQSQGLDASQLFGSDLTARCMYEQASLPLILRKCVHEVELRGIDVEGIYRKSGGNAQVQQVKQGFQQDGQNIDISDPDLDIHAVTSALKGWFRQLPNPLITFEVYDLFIETANIQDPEKKVAQLKRVIDDLPGAHRAALQYLCEHLSHVMKQEKVNLMTPLNLAVVFAPTLIRPLQIEQELTNQKPQLAAMQSLFENYKAIFAES